MPSLAAKFNERWSMDLVLFYILKNLTLFPSITYITKNKVGS